MIKILSQHTLQTRQQGSPFLTELKQKLLLSPNEAVSAGTHYNVPLINSLVLYVGMQVLVFNLILCFYLFGRVLTWVEWMGSIHNFCVHFTGYPAATVKITACPVYYPDCSIGCLFGGCCFGYIPDSDSGLRYWRALPFPKRNCKPTALSKHPHPLLLIHRSLLVCWIKPGETS